jgi:hypothetical protein
VVSAVWGDPQKVAAELVLEERLLFACRAKQGRVAIATDRQLVIAQPGDGGSPPRTIWSNAYPRIGSIEKRVRDFDTELTLETAGLPLKLVVPDQTNAEVLVRLGHRRRAIADSTNLDPSQ